MEKEDEAIVGKIYGVINKIAEEKGFKENGYRVIVNCGKDAGQEVMHLHFHLLSRSKIWRQNSLRICITFFKYYVII